MKPLFGGSALTSKKAKQKVLSMTESLKVYEMLSPIKTIAVESDNEPEDQDSDNDDVTDNQEYDNRGTPFQSSTTSFTIRDDRNMSTSNIQPSISLLYHIAQEDRQVSPTSLDNSIEEGQRESVVSSFPIIPSQAEGKGYKVIV